MKNHFFGFVVLFFCGASTQAQFKAIAQGPVFEEPENGFSKVLQMKDGSTLFFHGTAMN